MVNQDNNVGKRSQDNHKRIKVNHWNPQPVGWLKWNIDASRIDARHLSTIGIV